MSQGEAPLREKPGIAMPRSLMERAAKMLDAEPGDWFAPRPRSAATVALLRPGESGFEMFLQRRPATMAFAARMHVFPGGAVEQDDEIAAQDLGGASSGDRGKEAFGRDVLAARVAAVRETLEEVGYYIGDPCSLTYIAHWVTPEAEPRRYDTRFYATVISSSGPPPVNLTEADEALWIAPADALVRYAAGEMKMLPPTVAVLSQFAELAADGLGPHQAVTRAGSGSVRPMLPTPRRDPEAPHGIAWVIVDARSGEQIILRP